MHKSAFATLICTLAVLSSTTQAAMTELPNLVGNYQVSMQTCIDLKTKKTTKTQEFGDLRARFAPGNFTAEQAKQLDMISDYAFGIYDEKEELLTIHAGGLLYIIKNVDKSGVFIGQYFPSVTDNTTGKSRLAALSFQYEDFDGSFSVSELIENASNGILGNSLCTVGELSTVYFATAAE